MVDNTGDTFLIFISSLIEDTVEITVKTTHKVLVCLVFFLVMWLQQYRTESRRKCQSVKSGDDN